MMIQSLIWRKLSDINIEPYKNYYVQYQRDWFSRDCQPDIEILYYDHKGDNWCGDNYCISTKWIQYVAEILPVDNLDWWFSEKEREYAEIDKKRGND